MQQSNFSLLSAIKGANSLKKTAVQTACEAIFVKNNGLPIMSLRMLGFFFHFYFCFSLAFLLTPTFPCSSIIFPDSLLLHIYICFLARKHTTSSSRRARDSISIKELQSCIQTSRIITQKEFSLCFFPPKQILTCSQLHTFSL